MFIYDEDKVIEIFCKMDDWCNDFFAFEASKVIDNGQPTRVPGLAFSEIITILILYHQSGYKTFKDYYTRFVLKALKSYFPDLVSYERFITLIKRVFRPLYAILHHLLLQSGRRGLYFIDSTKLPVCDNRRIHSHKVFEDLAKRGKTSTGWFFGFKLHLVINELGEIVAFKITTGNVADNNHDVLKGLLKGLPGMVFGDKGYLSKLFEYFMEKGTQIIAKLKKNMKGGLQLLEQALFAKKRSVIESVNEILKHNCDIWHNRHRSPINALIHLLAGLAAYQFRERKPHIINPL